MQVFDIIKQRRSVRLYTEQVIEEDKRSSAG